MNTELDQLIIKIKRLFNDTIYLEETSLGVKIDSLEFFEKLKPLLKEMVTLENKEEKSSKLEWEQSPPSNPMTWDEATQYADSLNTMSDYGWRLPTKRELEEVYHTKVKGFQSYNYWSSTIEDVDTLNAWYVDFSDGVGHYYYKKGRVFVRCVREVK